MEENATAIQTLQYLYSIDTCLTGISKVDNILRQNYLEKAKRLEQKEGITLPNKTIKPRVKCPKCCMPRADGLAEFRLDRNAVQNRFLARLKRKMDDGRLTKYQQRFLKKKKGMLDQVQSIHCKVCKYVVKEPVKNPDFLNIKCEETDLSKTVEKKFVKNENKQGRNKQMYNKHGMRNNNIQCQQKDNKNKGKGKVVKQKPNKNNKRQQNKMQTMLTSACKLKSTNLKDFIKSVT